METCLSPSKHHLVCDVASQTDPAASLRDNKTPFDEETGLLSWSCIAKANLISDNNEKPTESQFEEYVVKLAPYCHVLHEWVVCLGDEDIKARYEKHLEWTGNVQVFLDCFTLARSDHGVSTGLSILLSTAALERALGDVFLLKSNEPCPAMLKNLLATQELSDVLGQNVITLLRILIGPPTSLNLRNILWHGFAAPDEIPQRYGTFLLIVTASLGHLLMECGISPASIRHRKPLALPQLEIDAFLQRFPDIRHDDLDIVLDLYSSTTFFHKPMFPYCKAALDYFRERKYGLTVVLLLPLLENGVRKLFATANNCPERVLTAESDYFTTFDEMLSPNISDELANELIPAIGESYMEMLLDLLVHPEGPRLRDHISHGELDFATITRATAVYVVTICTAFCLRNCQKSSLLETPVVRLIRTTAATYTSLFHPVSLLKSELATFLKALSLWLGISMPDDENDSYHTWSVSETGRNEVSEAAQCLLKVHCGKLGEPQDCLLRMVMPFVPLDPLQTFVKESTARTLFRPRRELEVTSLLRRITVQCLAACSNVRNIAELRYRQHVAKELRSRQRANYTRLLNSIPRMSYGLRLVALVLFCQLRGLGNITDVTPKDVELNIKFLKAILRFAENLNSLSSPEKNKWDECCCLTNSLEQQIKTHCTKLAKTQGTNT